MTFVYTKSPGGPCGPLSTRWTIGIRTRKGRGFFFNVII